MPFSYPAAKTLFLLKPDSSELNTYDPANPNDPWAIVNFYAYGIHCGVLNDSPFADQCSKEQILLAYSPKAIAQYATTTPNLVTYTGDIFPYSSLDIRVWIHNWNIADYNHIIVSFNLGRFGPSGNPIAQFFSGGQWLHSESITGDQIVSLYLGLAGIDPAATFNAAPYANGFGIVVRLAQKAPVTWPEAGIFFKSMDCRLGVPKSKFHPGGFARTIPVPV
jgi:hypothetical protein